MASEYVLAGYHLVRMRPLRFGSYEYALVPTGSHCINDSLLDSFSRPWTSNSNIEEQAQKDFLLTADTLQTIQTWTNQADIDHQIGYLQCFYTLEAALDYYHRFFHSLINVVLLGIYLPMDEAQALKKDFTPQGANIGETGISVLCGQAIPEEDKGVLLGYEPIGVGIDGSFHSMHCYGTAFAEIVAHFDLTLNDHLLLDSDANYPALIEYFNDENNGLGQDPWYFAKVKRFPLH